MPYSQPLGLVYVAIPKTGSTSMIRALREVDVHPKRLQFKREPVTPQFRKRYRLDELEDKKPGRGKHLSALQLKHILGEEEFERCVKFSIVRNPWARTVSMYFFTHVDYEPSEFVKKERETSRTFHALDFEVWLNKRWKRYKNKKEINAQFDKISDEDGNILVDHVGRLEEIQETLRWLSDKIGVDSMTMPHKNGTRNEHYAKFYNENTRDMVAEMYRTDIERFKYSFEPESN